jgi:hypothetical protein
LINSQLPPAAKELDKELRQILKEKDDAVRSQDFDRAGELRDREMEIKAEIRTIAQTKSNGASGDGVEPVVTEEDIAHIVASWTGVPVNKLTESESEKLLHMEDTLHQRLIGQEDAVKAVSRAIRRARVGLKNPNRPIASFVFSGPTGVGKTELAKSLASYFFGAEEAMIRLDMSEYMERHTVSKLIGSPPGYVGYNEGGQLTEAVRRRPYTVVLFDEIEKAHPDVFNMLLQILATATAYNGVYAQFGYTNSWPVTANMVEGVLAAASLSSILIPYTQSASCSATLSTTYTGGALRYTTFNGQGSNGALIYFYNIDPIPATGVGYSTNLYAGSGTAIYTNYDYTTQSCIIPKEVDPRTISFYTENDSDIRNNINVEGVVLFFSKLFDISR